MSLRLFSDRQEPVHLSFASVLLDGRTELGDLHEGLGLALGLLILGGLLALLDFTKSFLLDGGLVLAGSSALGADLVNGKTLNGLEDTGLLAGLLLLVGINLTLLVQTSPLLGPGKTLGLDLLEVQRASLLVQESNKLSVPADETSAMTRVDPGLGVEANVGLDNHLK